MIHTKSAGTSFEDGRKLTLLESTAGVMVMSLVINGTVTYSTLLETLSLYCMFLHDVIHNRAYV